MNKHSDQITKKPSQTLGDLRSERVSHWPTLAFVTVHVAWQWLGVEREKEDLA